MLITTNISVNRAARWLDEYMELMQDGGPQYFIGDVKGLEPRAVFHGLSVVWKPLVPIEQTAFLSCSHGNLINYVFNPVNNLTSCFFKIYSYIMLPSMPRSYK